MLVCNEYIENVGNTLCYFLAEELDEKIDIIVMSG